MNASELAQKYEFKDAQYLGDVNGMAIYAGAMEDPSACVGLPFYILEKNGEARVASTDETFKLMNMFPKGPNKE